jgi:hypothetical protein
MAFVHGKGTVVLFNATDLSGYLKEVQANQGVDTADVTAFGTTGAKAYIVGLKDGAISAAGMFDGASDASDSVFQAALGASAGVFSSFPDGAALGKRGFIASVNETTYNISSPVADVVQASAEFQTTGGIDYSESLHALSAETTTGNGTGNDNTTSSTNGGVAHLHVTANSRNGSTTVKIQHSADNSTWADLVTFTAVSTSTTTSERVVVAAGTTVNRYLRTQHTLAGSTGSITYQTSFARR